MKRRRPCTSYTICQPLDYHISLAGGRCPRVVGGKRCLGINENYFQENDWAECPSCAATGWEGDKACSQCDRPFWLLICPQVARASASGKVGEANEITRFRCIPAQALKAHLQRMWQAFRSDHLRSVRGEDPSGRAGQKNTRGKYLNKNATN